MIRSEQQSANLYYWYTDDQTTWDDFHIRLDNLTQQIAAAAEPFSVVVFTSNKQPTGNPLPHLRRLLRIVSKSDMIAAFIVINVKGNMVAQHLTQFAMRTFGSSDKMHIVRSEEEALIILETNRA